MKKDIDDFIKENEFNINETKEWKDLIIKIIETYKLKSYVDKDLNLIYIEDSSNKEFIENILYKLEDSKTTLEYIFEGNVYYNIRFFDKQTREYIADFYNMEELFIHIRDSYCECNQGYDKLDKKDNKMKCLYCLELNNIDNLDGQYMMTELLDIDYEPHFS